MFIWGLISLRASSPIWASEASLARTRERAAKLARRLGSYTSWYTDPFPKQFKITMYTSYRLHYT